MKNNMTRLVNSHLPHRFNSKTLHTLDFVASGRLLGIDVVATPTSPSPGDAYHTALQTTGLWDTLRMNDQLVVWTGSAWNAVVPYLGFTAVIPGAGRRVYVGSEDPLQSAWREVGTGGASVFRTFRVELQEYSGGAGQTSASGEIIPGGDPNYVINWAAQQYYPLLPPGVGGGIKNLWGELTNDNATSAEFSSVEFELVAPSGVSGVGEDRFPSAYDAYVTYPYYPISPLTVDDISGANPVRVLDGSAPAPITTNPIVAAASSTSQAVAFNTYSSFINQGARGAGWLCLKVNSFTTGTTPIPYSYPATLTLLAEMSY